MLSYPIVVNSKCHWILITYIAKLLCKSFATHAYIIILCESIHICIVLQDKRWLHSTSAYYVWVLSILSCVGSCWATPNFIIFSFLYGSGGCDNMSDHSSRLCMAILGKYTAKKILFLLGHHCPGCFPLQTMWSCWLEVTGEVESLSVV